MTTTLLKHEWLRTRGALGMFFGVLTLVVFLGSLLGATGWSVIYGLGLLLAIVAVAVLVPATQLLLAADYWRSGYGRTGYFTHSIPVRGATIFRAKLIWAAIVSLVAAVLTVPLALVAWWAISLNSQADPPSFSAIGIMWSNMTSVTPAWMLVVGALLVLALILMSPVYYYYSVSIGNESRLSGLGAAAPIVVFVVLYIGTQIASFLGMVVIPFGVGMEGERLQIVWFNVLSEMAAGTPDGADVMPVGFVAAMGVILVYCAWRTARSWNHKVALS